MGAGVIGGVPMVGSFSAVNAATALNASTVGAQQVSAAAVHGASSFTCAAAPRAATPLQAGHGIQMWASAGMPLGVMLSAGRMLDMDPTSRWVEDSGAMGIPPEAGLIFAGGVVVGAVGILVSLKIRGYLEGRRAKSQQATMGKDYPGFI